MALLMADPFKPGLKELHNIHELQKKKPTDSGDHLTFPLHQQVKVQVPWNMENITGDQS